MDKREQFISLIKTLPEERVGPVMDLVADKLLVTEEISTAPSVKADATLDKSGFIIFEHVYESGITLSSDVNLSLSYKNRPVDVKITAETMIPEKYIRGGETVYIIGRIYKECIAMAVVSKEFYEMFVNFDSIEMKLNAMGKYLNLRESDQKRLKAQLSGEKFETVKTASYPPDDMNAFKFKFDMCRHTYTPQQQRDIEAIFDECRSLASANREKSLRKLSYILNISQGTLEEVTMTKEEIIEKLDKCLHKHAKIKEKLAEAIVASKYSTNKGFCVLLVGSPGVGKTAIMKAVAKVLQIPFFVLPLGSYTSLIDVVGDASQYEASDCGELVKKFRKVGTTYAVVGLDEYDKSYELSKEGGKISKAFNDAVSDEHFFRDNYLGTYINTANTIFIATANSTDTIPENLLNRFTVIHVDDYGEEDKLEIAQKFIIPSELHSYNISEEELTFDSDAISYIAQNFCEDDGARDLRKNIEKIVRRVVSVWDSTGKREKVSVDVSFVDDVLESTVNKNSPVIVHRRNKKLYSPEVTAEIKDLASKLRRDSLESGLRDKYDRKLDYLVNLIPVGNAFSDFKKDSFYADVNSTHYGMDSVKLEIAQIFNVCTINKKPLSSNRLLFVGPPGAGKTSVVKSVARACNSPYCKISLNGISDDAAIKGHSLSYVGADAGVIVKALYKMRTTKGIVHLDEIDKLGSKNGVSVSNTLVDMLDDSAEFTDNFIGLPVDLSGVMFIATANDICEIDPVILDRFTVIHLDGYTEKEKAEITRNYLIPKAVSEFVPEEYQLEFSDGAQKLITEVYCRSLGVRDADKAVRKLVRYKLYNSDERSLVIDVSDVEAVMGKPPAERGNFPHENYPGLSKALAVTGDNCGMAFSVETMLIPDENSLTITGLPKESTVDSVKLAISYVKCRYPGKLANKGVHIHFGEGAVHKDGPSAGVAILMSLLSAVSGTPICEDVSYTGEINGNGYVFNIGGTIAKIQAAEQSGCKKVFIPYGNYKELDKEKLQQFSVEIVPVRHVSEVIEAVLPDMGTDKKSA